MSAFVCDDETIDLIVAGLFHAKEFGGYHPNRMRWCEPADDLAAAMGDDPASFGRTLYAMNVNAVEQRYEDAIGNPDNLPGQVDAAGHHLPYTYHSMSASDRRTQFYKSLQCYLYQCSEGDVPSLPLYGMLRQYQSDLARWWVESLPEYEQATWG